MTDASEFDFLAEAGLDVVEAARAGYAEIRSPDGRSMWVSTMPPVNPAMVSDLYQFTMMAAYVEAGKAEEEATFYAHYRRNPFGGGFTLTAGLERILEYLERLQFTGRDIDHMRSRWKMPDSFYEYLRAFRFTGTVDALPEGTMAQPYLPVVQVTAPLPMANFVETFILNQLGFATLVATKAARIATQTPNPFLEFGLRRSQGGVEGGLIAARSAYLGGASGTSNVAAEQALGIPASGTHAHSFIMAFPTQREAFEAYADVFGAESVFLIDTYGYTRGMEDAVAAARAKGLATFKGVRDDSGDLSYQSKIIRRILDDNGFPAAKIVASNDLDERSIRELHKEGAKIDLYGIGTKLVTADPDPSLGIVYKLVECAGRKAIKLSGDPVKITDPGRKQVWRLVDEGGQYAADVMLGVDETLGDEITVQHRSRGYESKHFASTKGAIPVLETVMEKGRRLRPAPALDDIRHRAAGELRRMWPELKRLENPAEYLVGLSPALNALKADLIRRHAIRK